MTRSDQDADDVGADESDEADGACKDDGDRGEDPCSEELFQTNAFDVESHARGFVVGERAGVVGTRSDDGEDEHDQDRDG